MSAPSAAVRAAGSIHVLRTPSFPSAPYPETAPEPITDEQVAELIKPILARHAVHENLPPLWLLVRVYRNAHRHFLGPRRKRFAPHTRPRQWSLHDCEKCTVSWFSGRPDHTGAWRQHMELADWPKRTILVPEVDGGELPPAPPDPAKEAARRDYERRKAMADAEKAAKEAAAEPPKKIDMRTREGKALKEAARATAS